MIPRERSGLGWGIVVEGRDENRRRKAKVEVAR